MDPLKNLQKLQETFGEPEREPEPREAVVKRAERVLQTIADLLSKEPDLLAWWRSLEAPTEGEE